MLDRQHRTCLLGAVMQKEAARMQTTEQDTLVTYALEDKVAVIGLNRPEKRNAIGTPVMHALDAAMARATQEARAAVIFGAGAHFCAGLDLAEHVEKTPFEAVRHSHLWHEVFDRIARGTIPVVSALSGAVIGGGFELAAATHIRVASEDAFFALPEGTRGIYVGGGGSVRIARLIGAARMADLMLTGRSVAASQMEHWGGVSYVTAPGAARDRALELAARAAENAEMSNYAILNALPRIQDMSAGDGLFLEALMSALTTTTPEAEARLRAFLDKRAGTVATPDKR